jgi:hypothetical protein
VAVAVAVAVAEAVAVELLTKPNMKQSSSI